MDEPTAILVTGSAGLIGSLLVKQLAQKEAQVIEFDNRLPTHYIAYGDTRDPKRLAKLVNQCKGIIHLAAVSRVVWGEQDPALCWDTNVTGTHHLLETIYQSQHRPWLIFASSREVYGQQNHFPVSENAPLMPLNTYARSKVAGEELVKRYRDLGLTTAILRFSSVYGSIEDHADRVIPAFCRNAVIGQALRIDGVDNLFDFTHVQDTVNGILATITRLENQIADLPPIHFTTGIGTSLIEIVQLIEKTLDRALNYYQAPARTYDVHRFYGDPTSANKLLGWQPQISLQQGIKAMLSQFQSQLRATESFSLESI